MTKINIYILYIGDKHEDEFDYKIIFFEGKDGSSQHEINIKMSEIPFLRTFLNDFVAEGNLNYSIDDDRKRNKWEVKNWYKKVQNSPKKKERQELSQRIRSGSDSARNLITDLEKAVSSEDMHKNIMSFSPNVVEATQNIPVALIEVLDNANTKNLKEIIERLQDIETRYPVGTIIIIYSDTFKIIEPKPVVAADLKQREADTVPLTQQPQESQPSCFGRGCVVSGGRKTRKRRRKKRKTNRRKRRKSKRRKRRKSKRKRRRRK